MSLAATILIAIVVMVILSASRGSEDKTTAKKKVYALRNKYFWGLTILVIVGLFTTLQSLPYSFSGKQADETYTVVALQWGWKIAPGVSNVAPADFEGADEINIKANKTIKFIVTSQDVNHDFSIYNDEGVLLTQTQAMPGYKNVLHYTFPKPGTYHVVCLEYCGGAHDYMVTTINVI